MFVFKAAHRQPLPRPFLLRFFPPAPLTHSLTHSLPLFCCFLKGWDAVQIAVASRDCLSSPPVAHKSIHKQITPALDLWAATLKQQAELDPCLDVLFLFCLFSFPAAYTFWNFPLLPSTGSLPLFPSPIPTLHQAPAGSLHWHSPQCESVRAGVCVYFFGSSGQIFSRSSRTGGERGDPCKLCDLPKQTAGVRAVPPASGCRTVEINLSLWTSEGSVHLKRRPLWRPALGHRSSDFTGRATAGQQPPWTESGESSVLFPLKVRTLLYLSLHRNKSVTFSSNVRLIRMLNTSSTPTSDLLCGTV